MPPRVATARLQPRRPPASANLPNKAVPCLLASNPSQKLESRSSLKGNPLSDSVSSDSALGGATEEINRLGPGQYFGENALNGAPRNATVRALTHAIVYEIAGADVATILKAHPELQGELDRAFADLRRSAAASLMPEPGVHEDGLPAGRIFERISKLLTH